MIRLSLTAALCASAALPAFATDLEVTHWWTSGGEAAAVAELARAFDATGDTWKDGAIAGSGGTALPIIVSRITGGEPMGATQFNHGQQARELVEAGLMQDLTEVAEAEGWRDFVNPPSLLDACTVDGRIYCAPVNIHSWQWLWLSHAAFEKAGVPVPTTWDEFVASGPALREAGLIPLAMGQQPWQSGGAFSVMAVAIAGPEVWKQVHVDKNAEVAAGPVFAKVFEAAVAARELASGNTVQDWNQATNLVIAGEAGGQIMGDWAQGEFQVAGQVAGTDYSCLPGLGVNALISTGGDAFYFPVNDDPDITAAQLRLASVLMAKETQVAFNLKKGSLPIRGDIDLAAANDCMQKGLQILAAGDTIISGDEAMARDTVVQIEELMAEFWSGTAMSAEDAQARYVDIIGSAE